MSLMIHLSFIDVDFFFSFCFIFPFESANFFFSLFFFLEMEDLFFVASSSLSRSSSAGYEPYQIAFLGFLYVFEALICVGLTAFAVISFVKTKSNQERKEDQEVGRPLMASASFRMQSVCFLSL